MPRGVYPRKNKGTKAAAAPKAQPAKTPKLTKSGKPRRRRRTKAEMEAARATTTPASPKKTKQVGHKKAAKPVAVVAKTTAAPGRQLDVAEQFAVVRDNVVALSQVRNNLASRTQDTKAIDAELQSELELMGILRHRHFGNLTEETTGEPEGEEPEHAAGADNGTRTSTVPLPPPPQIQPPPTPPAA